MPRREGVRVLIRRLDPELALPAYAHPGDAGADLVSSDEVVLAPGERATVGTGVSIALPDGFVAFVVPRSGLAAKHGITIVNSPGTVDAGYRGEIAVTLLNTDTKTHYGHLEQKGDFDVARAGWIADYKDPESFLGISRKASAR